MVDKIEQKKITNLNSDSGSPVEFKEEKPVSVMRDGIIEDDFLSIHKTLNPVSERPENDGKDEAKPHNGDAQKPFTTQGAPKINIAKSENPEKLALALHKQIEGFSRTEKTKELLFKIDLNNVIKVIEKYKENSHNTLIQDLAFESGLNAETVREFIGRPLLQRAREAGAELSHYNDFNNITDLNKLSDYVDEIIFLTKNKEAANEIKKQSAAAREEFDTKFDIPTLSLSALKKQYGEENYIFETYNHNFTKGEAAEPYYLEKIVIKDKNTEKNVKVIEKAVYKEQGAEETYYYINEYDKNENLIHSFNVKDNLVVSNEISNFDKDNYLVASRSITFDNNGVIKSDFLYEGFQKDLVQIKIYENGELQFLNRPKEELQLTYAPDGMLLKEETPDGVKEYYPNGNINIEHNIAATSFFDRKGRPVMTDDTAEGRRIYALNKRLQEDFVSKGAVTSTVSYRLEEDIFALVKGNIKNVLKQYKEDTGQHLEDTIRNSRALNKEQKQRYLKHIELTLCEATHFDPKFHNTNSKIKNKYYTGKMYDVKFDGYKAEITQRQTGRKTKLNLEKMLKNLSMEDKVKYAATIQRLPAEVLEDLAIECMSIQNRDSKGSLFNSLEKITTKLWYGYSMNSAGFAWMPLSSMHSINRNGTITHELGHLIDSADGGKCLGLSSQNKDFKDIYEREKALYLESSKREGYKAYAAENIQEFFAESYKGIMTGQMDEDIIEFFPKSFEMFKRQLEQIRSMTPDERNAMKNNLLGKVIY